MSSGSTLMPASATQSHAPVPVSYTHLLSPSPAFIFPRLVSCSLLVSSFLHAGLSLCLSPPAFIFPSLVPCSRLVSSFLHAGLFLYLPTPAFIFPSLVPCSRLVSSLLHAGLSLYLQHRRSFFPALSPVPASFPLFCTPACQQPLPFQSLYLPFALVSSTRYFSTSSACSA